MLQSEDWGLCMYRTIIGYGSDPQWEMLQDQSDKDRMCHNQSQETNDSHPHICKRLPHK